MTTATCKQCKISSSLTCRIRASNPTAATSCPLFYLWKHLPPSKNSSRAWRGTAKHLELPASVPPLPPWRRCSCGEHHVSLLLNSFFILSLSVRDQIMGAGLLFNQEFFSKVQNLAPFIGLKSEIVRISENARQRL